MNVQKPHELFRAVEPAKPGFDPTDYHKMGSEFPRGDGRRIMSRGELVEFAKCPQRWRMGYKEEEADTKATEWGSLLDCLITQPGQFEQIYAIAPEQYPSTPKKKGAEVEMKPWNYAADYCKEWREQQWAIGKEVVKKEVADEAFAAQDRIQSDERLQYFIACSRKQVLVLTAYVDPQTGFNIPMKCLVDLVPPPSNERHGDTLGDFKTTRDASPRAWEKDVYRYGLHIQAALYMDCYNASEGTSYKRFAHAIVENVAPFQTARRILSPSFLDLGRSEYRRALADYAWCLKTDQWPGYEEWNTNRGSVIDGWRTVEPEDWMIGLEE